MTDTYALILNELVERGCAHVARFPPYFICSIGCHLFNLYNKENQIYFIAGRVIDLRLPVLFVAPPGFSKTFWLEQFLRGIQAILVDSGIDTGFEGAMTEAGLVGTVRFVDGEPVVVSGAAKLYKYAIIGIEEFSALTEMMKQQYSRQLDTALLGALDSGWVYKRLAAGNIRYQTFMTLWCGTQPARFDLTSGLGRRFLFIEFIPTKLDFQMLKLARRRARNVAFNPIRTDRIRNELRRLMNQIKKIKKVEFSPKVFEFFDKNNIIHYEEMLMERLLLGYTIMRGRYSSTIKVQLDDTNRELLKRELKFRNSIRRGSEVAEVIMILRENGGSMPIFELKNRLLMFGKDWSQSSELIRQLCAMKALQLKQNAVVLNPSLRIDQKKTPWKR